MRMVALLRGVNVGGKNKLPMPLLKSAFERAGFENVATYINSGNVLFDSAQQDTGAVRAQCETLVAEEFGLDISMAVLTGGELAEALAHAPAWWGDAPDTKHNAIFVLPPATTQSVRAQVGEAKPDYEQVTAYGPVIFWSTPLKTFSRTRWSKVVGSAAYASVTIRNANTARKLAKMAKTAGPS